MAKQLNLLATERVIPTALHAEMQRSYLEYAMSVIVGRALPDVRDGLKPVHRRIVYAMHELGLTPDRPYRKCARVVGDVLGKYHPHGDQAVYDALVRMVQDFSSRYPLLDGHGNFGSVDNDPPAAMRYTETRLAPVSQEALLSEIGEATVDFIGNFDNSQQEPTVLPAQLPILLLNGCSGIAVGMATNIPPHNLGEVIDGLIALIERPDLPDEQLLEIIPAPDFPTGGEIVGKEGIKEAYLTGRGSITLRGVSTIEEIQGGKGRHRRCAIVVTELPFQVNKAGWIEKVAELVNQGKIEGIADLRDESDREGIRVVIELKRDINPHEILEQLYRQTALQSNFGSIFLALVDGQPRQLTLKQLLQEFLKFREETLTKQYRNELGEAERRIDIVEGLLGCLSNLDAIIDILRNAPDGSTAKLTMQQRFDFSDRQADAILAMPLRRLTGLEKQNLQTEFEELGAKIAQLQKLLGDRKELLKALKKDLRTLKRKYGDPRRSKLINEEQRSKEIEEQKSSQISNFKTEESQNEEVVLEFTHRGYVRRLPKNENKPFKSQDDFLVQTQAANTQADLAVVTRNGKAYPVKVSEIPATSSRSKGTPLVTLLSNSAKNEFQGSLQQAIVTNLLASEMPENASLILCTEQARIKRLPISELAMTGRGITLIKLKDDDQLNYAISSYEGEQVVLATSGGRVLRFAVNEQQLPLMGRAAQGLQGLRLGRNESLVGCLTLKSEENILIVSQLGYAKRLAVNTIRLANRGDIGTQAVKFSSKTDALAAMISAPASAEVMIITSTQRIVPLGVDSVNFWNKDGAGDRILELQPHEKIINVVLNQ